MKQKQHHKKINNRPLVRILVMVKLNEKEKKRKLKFRSVLGI